MNGNSNITGGSGPAAWLALPEDILCTAGKCLVSEDPDLSADTINKLSALHPPDFKKYTFNFGRETSDVGLTVLAGCIKEHQNGSLAEIIAAYSSLRKVPFVDTAIAVLELMEENNGVLKFFETIGFDRPAFVEKEWHPIRGGEGSAAV
jgi:hypothetical protein